MYRFYRKINANGRMNTDFFTEGNEGGASVFDTQSGNQIHETDSLRPGPIAFTNRQPFVAFAALL
jgi:hypothetical protein